MDEYEQLDSVSMIATNQEHEYEFQRKGSSNPNNCKCNKSKILIVTILLFLISGTILSVIMDKANMKGNDNLDVQNNAEHIQTDTNSNKNNPHIIWFVVDDLGHSDFSLQGSEYYTPNIDSLAYNGIQLKHHYTSPLCSPSRAAFISGRFAHTMGLSDLDDVFQPTTTGHLPSRYLTVADILQTVGYKTFAYGKWHLGYSKQSYTPTFRGFDHHYGYYQYSVNPFTKHNLMSFKRNGYDWFLDGNVQWDDSDVSLYSTQLISDRIESDIDSVVVANEQTTGVIDYHPMFMYIAFQNPHFPIVSPVDNMYDGYDGECEKLIDSHKHRMRYCRVVKYLDYAIGRVIKSLKNHKIYKNSLILMATDNGPLILHSCTSRNGFPSAGSAWPYRGTKYTYLQGGILTPAFVSGGIIDSSYHGKKNFHVWHATDWLKTILHFTNFYSVYNKIHDNDDSDESSVSSSLRDLSDIQFDTNLDTYYAFYVNTIDALLVSEMDGQDMYDILFDERFLSSETQVQPSDINLGDDRKFFMSNRDSLLLGVSEGDSNDFINACIIMSNGFKVLVNESFTGNCDVRSPVPGSKSWSAITSDETWDSEKCDLCLFDIANDPYETRDLLNYKGTDSDTYAQYEGIIEAALAEIERQWHVLEVQKRQFPQYYASFYNFSFDSAAFGVDGARVPFQDESEAEFPEECNTCNY